MKGPKAQESAEQYEALIAKHGAEWLELGAIAGPLADGLRPGRCRGAEGGRAALFCRAACQHILLTLSLTWPILGLA
jgi:hypothetical protein